ncbi:nucleotidyltransferase family protein, partial [Desulfobulbus sp. US2]|nr:nucleotidyltransferase family protein [Desulfobulbus sp. US2]
AEQQGLAPLLYHHSKQIDVPFPQDFRRLLHSLYQRSRQANTVRNRAVAEILTRYDTANVPVLTIKGIALCNFLYEEPGLRPMRDMDLLVSESDLGAAQEILLDLEYLPAEQHDIPEDYYHLPPLVKTIAGLPVTIELHRNLLPFHPRYPLWPLEKSYADSRSFSINGITARTLSLEETLQYVYLHGFQAPLTYEPFRLVHVADMVSLVDKYSEQINQQLLRKHWPAAINVLSRFHNLTPLQDTVISRFNLPVEEQADRAGQPYQGWPQRLLKDTGMRRFPRLVSGMRRFPRLVRDSLLPSRWWLQLYYGHLSGYGYWRARLFEHPREVWRWLKGYFLLYMKMRKKV